MYQDEFGNMWASYEDYQAYLNDVSKEENSNQQVVNELIGSFLSKTSTDVRKTTYKYIESGQNNE